MAGRYLVIALALAGALAGCSDPPYIDLPNPIIGSITEVQHETGRFVLTTPSGERFLFRNANPNDPRTGTGHMFQHSLDGSPVKVTWRRDGYELVAVSIEDGPRSSTSPTPAFTFPSAPPS